ncbi:MAG: tail fiber domain-containing protein, partial [Dolichospermum sp.]
EVKIQNTQELSESSDVLITTPTNGQILQYDSATSLWKNVAGTTSSIAEGSNLYYTDTRSRGAISLTTNDNNGASTYNSTTGVLNVPTYTLAGLGGINLTSLSATSPLLYDNTTGVFSIQQSSGSQAGFLSAADWTTFNNKVPSTRTLSINGTTYDLSADRSWTITPNVNATNTQDYTATAAQTTFTVTGGYTVGQLAVFYNGSKLASNEFTAINGTTFTLATACQANDIVQAVVSVTGGGIGGSGTTNYHSKWTASGVLGNSVIQDDGTNVGIGVAPNSSLSGYTFVTIGNAGSQFGGASANSFVSSNGYFNDGIWKYAVTGSFATLYEQLNGIHRFRYAEIGTAGNAITWNTGLTINTSGNVGVGTSTPSEKLDVIGGAVAAGNGTIRTGITYSSLGLIGTFSNHNLGILTNGSEKIRITTAGNVGIGTTNPSANLHVTSSTNSVIYAVGANNTYRAEMQVEGAGQFTGSLVAVPSAGTTYGGIPTSSIGLTTSSTALVFATNNTERMRIAANGTVLINSTTQSSAGIAATGTLQVYREILSAGVFAGLFWENRSGGVTSSSNWYGWYTTSGTIFLYNGSANAASINPSTGAYTPLSDKNKKKDFEASTIGLNAILGLKPTLYRMKDEDESVEKHLGFIAQEVKEFIPQAYIQTKGENEDFIGLDDRPIIAALVKAIQELKAEVDTLKQLVK